jgi:hypothetical protein
MTHQKVHNASSIPIDGFSNVRITSIWTFLMSVSLVLRVGLFRISLPLVLPCSSLVKWAVNAVLTHWFYANICLVFSFIIGICCIGPVVGAMADRAADLPYDLSRIDSVNVSVLPSADLSVPAYGWVGKAGAQLPTFWGVCRHIAGAHPPPSPLFDLGTNLT